MKNQCEEASGTRSVQAESESDSGHDLTLMHSNAWHGLLRAQIQGSQRCLDSMPSLYQSHQDL